MKYRNFTPAETSQTLEYKLVIHDGQVDRLSLTRPSKGWSGIALSLVYDSVCRLIGWGQINVTVSKKTKRN